MSCSVRPLVLLPILAALALGTPQIYAADSSKVEKCLRLPDCAIMDGKSGGEKSEDDGAQFDWKPFAKKMLRKIRRNWNPPDAARRGTPGQAKVRFYIEPDGQLACIEIKEFQGPPEFAAAAQAAVCESDPFRPFPRAIESSRPEPVNITFYYNDKTKRGRMGFGTSSED